MLFVSWFNAQTFVKIPFVQMPLFTVSADTIVKSLSAGGHLDLGTDLEINGGSGVYSFKWSKNGDSLGTALSLNVDNAGDYVLTIKDGSGCEAEVVYVVRFNTGTERVAEQLLNIYPIPAQSVVFVQLTQESVLRTVSVFSASGELLKHYKLQASNYDVVELSLEGIASGAYLLTCEFDNKKVSRIIIKK